MRTGHLALTVSLIEILYVQTNPCSVLITGSQSRPVNRGERILRNLGSTQLGRGCSVRICDAGCSARPGSRARRGGCRLRQGRSARAQTGKRVQPRCRQMLYHCLIVAKETRLEDCTSYEGRKRRGKMDDSRMILQYVNDH